jgi:hypothetical protein
MKLTLLQALIIFELKKTYMTYMFIIFSIMKMYNSF